MVTKDTVDEDIYAMQERKAKMNAAIMESNGAGSAATQFNSAAEKDNVLKTAVARYNATAAAVRGSGKENSSIFETDLV